MPNRQTQAIHKDSEPLQNRKSKQHPNQYGLRGNCSSLLLKVPSETLTGITSYLDPPSLLSLAQVNDLLKEHIANDNTWHRAFVCQFLGIGPECKIDDDAKSLMLRRTETSWRAEFIIRFGLRQRWEKSSNTPVSHIPVHSPVSSMYIMHGYSLLTSSLQYGIVARSDPLTGKILPGFLDASGTRAGLGVGNPNAEFTPNVSVCVLSSDGDMAKIIWGFRNGEVAVGTAKKPMDSRRTATEVHRCSVDDRHEGAILDAAWDQDGLNSVFVTAGADGFMKAWDAKTVRCLWKSEKNVKALVPDACVKVSVAFRHGFVIGVMRSGDIVVWYGLNFRQQDPFTATSAQEVRIPYPTLLVPKSDYIYGSYSTAILHVDVYAPLPTALVAYPDDPYFHQLRVENETGILEIRSFGDPSFGPIASLSPFFSEHSNFVLVGDHMGFVSVYEWDVNRPPPGSAVMATRKFEAYEDGSSVTALAWNGTTLITGSGRGSVKIWDALTFEHLRSPRSYVRGHVAQGERRDTEAVTQLLVGPEKDFLVASVGDRILAWRAGLLPGQGGGVRGRHSAKEAGRRKKDKGFAKYIKQLEMHQTINESKSLLKLESEQAKQRNGREQAQRARLESMGLDEAEAVDYLLMLTRDEATQEADTRSATMTYLTTDTEGVFEGDFDEIPYTSFASSSQDTLRRSSSPQGWEISSPELNQRTQTSSRHDLNTMQGSISPRSSLPNGIRTSPIRAGASSASIKTSIARSSGTSRSAGSASPRSIQSAWSTPLAQSIRNSPRASPTHHAAATSPRASQNGGSSSPRGASTLEDMDADMRFVIELSLAEARSRGEDV